MNKPEILILGPGGFKGFLTLGFLEFIYQKNYLNDIKYYCGVSIGSIISLLLILGYIPSEIFKISMQLNDIIKSDYKLNNIIFKKGLIPWIKLKNYLKKLICEKLGTVPSLNGLYNLTGKSLITVSYNINTQNTIYFNKNDYPDINVIDCVLSSCAIPFIFQPYKINMVESGSKKEYVFIDGAIVNSCPIDYMFNQDFQNFSKYNKNFKILCVSIISDNINLNDISNIDFLTIFIYIDRIISAHILEKIKTSLHNENIDHIVLKTNIFSPIGTILNDSDIGSMIMTGYNYGKSYIENKYQYDKHVFNKYKYDEISSVEKKFMNHS